MSLLQIMSALKHCINQELLGSCLMTIKLIPWNPTSWNTYKIHTKHTDVQVTPNNTSFPNSACLLSCLKKSKSCLLKYKTYILNLAQLNQATLLSPPPVPLFREGNCIITWTWLMEDTFLFTKPARDSWRDTHSAHTISGSVQGHCIHKTCPKESRNNVKPNRRN